MMKLYLTFFCVILSLIACSSALPANNELANSLFKRTQCKCGVFLADFDGSSDSKRHERVEGQMNFSQDEYGSTIVTGIFKSGFKGVNKPNFAIKDRCGRKLFDLSGLNVETTEDGGTKSFRKVFKNLSMDCGSDSIFAKDAKSSSCSGSNYKRQATGPSVSAVPPGTSAALAKFP
jgi:hypothetical protein